MHYKHKERSNGGRLLRWIMIIFEIEENIIEGEKCANIKMDILNENQIISLVIL